MVADALTGGPHFAALCERYIEHTKGGWARQSLILEDWQRDFWWEALEMDRRRRVSSSTRPYFARLQRVVVVAAPVPVAPRSWRLEPHLDRAPVARLR